MTEAVDMVSSAESGFDFSPPERGSKAKLTLKYHKRKLAFEYGCKAAPAVEEQAASESKEASSKSEAEAVLGQVPILDNPDDAKPKGMGHLAAAAWKGDAELVQELLEEGADMEVKDASGRTVLALAAIRQKPDIMNLLIEKKANVDAKDDGGISALMWAARDGHANEVEILADAGADVNAPDEDGMTAIKLAALFNHVDVLRVLVGSGADPKPALAFAQKFPSKSPDAVRFLLKTVLKDNLPPEQQS
mmetsp:Transcript_138095/g.240173  ORF Transcript_138095/g.240173 Transcript_138095/m.240173 type:complete len:248 (-) Transcript_138095:16-759(-)